ncbi:MAG TPA: fimbria/pilus periplasmic chaperone, partial [Cellvibrio sp.]
MRLQLFKLFATLITFSLIVQSASANLLINPTRVQFNPSDRTTDVTLINTSQVTTTYRLEWAEKKAKANGGYTDLDSAAAANFPVASKMLRFSPKQVTLKPNERQTIKLAIRRPQGLADGEYRSHLLFRALPPTKNSVEKDQQTASTVIAVVLNFAIPVVIQQGTPNYTVNANSARILFNPSKKDGSVEVDLSRSGIHSMIGNISAYWTPAGGKEQLIAKLGDYNFWPELSTARATLHWVGTDFAPADGKLRLVYEGAKDF